MLNILRNPKIHTNEILLLSFDYAWLFGLPGGIKWTFQNCKSLMVCLVIHSKWCRFNKPSKEFCCFLRLNISYLCDKQYHFENNDLHATEMCTTNERYELWTLTIYDPPYRCWGLNSWPLESQAELLTAEPSLYSHRFQSFHHTRFPPCPSNASQFQSFLPTFSPCL